MNRVTDARPFVSRTEAEALADAQAQLLKARNKYGRLEELTRNLLVAGRGSGLISAELMNAIIAAQKFLREEAE